MLVERPEFVAVAAESDPERQVQMLAGLDRRRRWRGSRRCGSRTAKPRRLTRKLRPTSSRPIADAARPSGRDRHGSRARLRHRHNRSADTMWAIGSIDVFLLLRTVLDGTRRNTPNG